MGEYESEYRRVEADLLRIRAWLERHPAEYGGIWLDRGPMGEGPYRVGVALARYRAGLETEVRALAQAASVDVVSVRWDLRKLSAVQDRIASPRTRGSKHLRGCTMPTIGVDQKANRVKVGLHPYDVRAAAWLLREFGRYRVTVVAGEPVHFRPGVASDIV